MLKSIPNILTITRILLLPFFVAAFMYNHYQAALIIFIFAGITDMFDGLIARKTGSITELGRILDPVADKFFLVTSFILMSYYGMIPKWITIVVISRDMILVTGCLITYFIVNNLNIEPTFIGKAASAMQFLLIGFVILFKNIGQALPMPNIIFIVIAAFTVISGLQYIQQGLKVVNSSPGET